MAVRVLDLNNVFVAFGRCYLSQGVGFVDADEPDTAILPRPGAGWLAGEVCDGLQTRARKDQKLTGADFFHDTRRGRGMEGLGAAAASDRATLMWREEEELGEGESGRARGVYER